MSNHAFIFARGGSKGLPGKNIKPLAGKPLIHYSIEVAQECSLIDKVFVSTDDAEIAAVAKECCAEIIERPSELATDTAAEWLAWRHAIEYVQTKYGHFDKFISLPATSPLRSVSDVVNAINQLDEAGADICIGITPAGRSPYFNMVKYGEGNFLNLVIEPAADVTRRQDSPAVFDITTVVYAAIPEFIQNKFGIFTGKVTSVQIPKERAVDIDDIYDFIFAGALLNDFSNNKKN